MTLIAGPLYDLVSACVGICVGFADAKGWISLSPLAAGASATYVISVELDPGATNADQGLTATIPLTWSITQ